MPESPVVSQQPVDGGRWLGQAGPGRAASLCAVQAGAARSQADRVSGHRSGYTQTHEQPQSSLNLSKETDQALEENIHGIS